jgi:hypothetical protein
MKKPTKVAYLAGLAVLGMMAVAPAPALAELTPKCTAKAYAEGLTLEVCIWADMHRVHGESRLHINQRGYDLYHGSRLFLGGAIGVYKEGKREQETGYSTCYLAITAPVVRVCYLVDALHVSNRQYQVYGRASSENKESEAYSPIIDP